ncbi:hypothetical protein JXL19_12120 [bacterium]|nr:hypothetical protein [bacterium]
MRSYDTDNCQGGVTTAFIVFTKLDEVIKMKRATLDRGLYISKENKILVKLFEESLKEKLDEIFRKESPNLYNDLSKGLKKAICNLCPGNGDGTDASRNH